MAGKRPVGTGPSESDRHFWRLEDFIRSAKEFLRDACLGIDPEVKALRDQISQIEVWGTLQAVKSALLNHRPIDVLDRINVSKIIAPDSDYILEVAGVAECRVLHWKSGIWFSARVPFSLDAADRPRCEYHAIAVSDSTSFRLSPPLTAEAEIQISRIRREARREPIARKPRTQFISGDLDGLLRSLEKDLNDGYKITHFDDPAIGSDESETIREQIPAARQELSELLATLTNTLGALENLVHQVEGNGLINIVGAKSAIAQAKGGAA